MRERGRRTTPALGLVEWFRPGEHEEVERVLEHLKALGVGRLRTGFSWADAHADGSGAWFDWLIPRLASEVEVLPCFHYTPPSLGMEHTSASPPRDPKSYADFLDVTITRLGRHFEWVELWNEPNNLSDWDWRLDPDWMLYCRMVGGAAYWARQKGKKTVLGGLCPTDCNWLRLAGERGVLAQCDAVGIHGFPATWEFDWADWVPLVEKVRQAVAPFAPEAELWITEAGFSTWKHDEMGQMSTFARALEAPVQRLYWYSVCDLNPDLPTQDGLHADERHYHMGLLRADRSPKLLSRIWESEGVEAVREFAEPSRTEAASAERADLIFGGAGYLGSNLAHRLLSEGRPVLLFDNLERPGSERNFHRLKAIHGARVGLQIADVRDRFAIRQALQRAERVFDLVAPSPRPDQRTEHATHLDIAVRGTLNLLDELASLPEPPPLVFGSTIDVYAPLDDQELKFSGGRVGPLDRTVLLWGIPEDWPLEFRSPLGCSRGSAEQYVLDYARTRGLPAVLLRLSRVIGDALWNTDAAEGLEVPPFSPSSENFRVCDALRIDDFVRACLLAADQAARLSGQVFNIGGGPENACSLADLRERRGAHTASDSGAEQRLWSPAEHQYFATDCRRFQAETGWRPRPLPAKRGLAARRAVAVAPSCLLKNEVIV